jgi:hypothetical protein
MIKTKKNIILATKKEKPSKEVKETVLSLTKKILTSAGYDNFIVEWIPDKPINKLLISIVSTDEEIENIKLRFSSAPLLKKHTIVLASVPGFILNNKLVRE